MQLLFYMNDMWTVSGWTIDESYAPAVRGATDLLAEYLSGAVNGEKVKSETNNRLVAMGGQALADALAAPGGQRCGFGGLVGGGERSCVQHHLQHQRGHRGRHPDAAEPLQREDL